MDEPSEEAVGWRHVLQTWKDQATLRRRVAEKYGVEEPLRRQIAHAAVENIKELHKQAGISLSDEDFPQIFLIPEANEQSFKAETGMRGDESVDSMHFDSHIACVLLTDDIFLNAVSIHHELFQGIERQTKQKATRDLGVHQQAGLITKTARNKKFGEVLEEGSAEFFAYQFALENNSPPLVSARQEIQAKHGDIPNPVLWKLRMATPDDYRMSADLVGKILHDGGQDIQNTLLRARLFAADEGSLVRKLDGLYGKEKAKSLLSLPFHPDAIYAAMQNLAPVR